MKSAFLLGLPGQLLGLIFRQSIELGGAFVDRLLGHVGEVDEAAVALHPANLPAAFVDFWHEGEFGQLGLLIVLHSLQLLLFLLPQVKGLLIQLVESTLVYLVLLGAEKLRVFSSEVLVCLLDSWYERTLLILLIGSVSFESLQLLCCFFFLQQASFVYALARMIILRLALIILLPELESTIVADLKISTGSSLLRGRRAHVTRCTKELFHPLARRHLAQHPLHLPPPLRILPLAPADAIATEQDFLQFVPYLVLDDMGVAAAEQIAQDFGHVAGAHARHHSDLAVDLPGGGGLLGAVPTEAEGYSAQGRLHTVILYANITQYIRGSFQEEKIKIYENLYPTFIKIQRIVQPYRYSVTWAMFVKARQNQDKSLVIDYSLVRVLLAVIVKQLLALLDPSSGGQKHGDFKLVVGGLEQAQAGLEIALVLGVVVDEPAHIAELIGCHHQDLALEPAQGEERVIGQHLALPQARDRHQGADADLAQVRADQHALRLDLGPCKHAQPRVGDARLTDGQGQVLLVLPVSVDLHADLLGQDGVGAGYLGVGARDELRPLNHAVVQLLQVLPDIVLVLELGNAGQLIGLEARPVSLYFDLVPKLGKWDFGFLLLASVLVPLAAVAKYNQMVAFRAFSVHHDGAAHPLGTPTRFHLQAVGFGLRLFFVGLLVVLDLHLHLIER